MQCVSQRHNHIVAADLQNQLHLFCPASSSSSSDYKLLRSFCSHGSEQQTKYVYGLCFDDERNRIIAWLRQQKAECVERRWLPIHQNYQHAIHILSIQSNVSVRGSICQLSSILGGYYTIPNLGIGCSQRQQQGISNNWIEGWSTWAVWWLN